MGELDLLRHVYAYNAALPERVTIPPGDDMAMLRLDGRDLLITVDQVADGVHVDCTRTPLELVARKAITRNLSDVAAMAALPVGAVVAAALPRTFGDDNAKRLFDAMHDTAGWYDCPLVGGDTMIWDGPLMLTVTVFAEPAGVTPITRSGARPGDLIGVTGKLGGAWRRDALDGGSAAAHHLTFEPRIDLARRLAIELNVTAMIDLSDGLATDLVRICEHSDVAAQLRIDDLPVSDVAHAAAQHDDQPAWLHALTDGEDYELCFTVRQGDDVPQRIDAIMRQSGVDITLIGDILPATERPESGRVWTIQGDTREPLTATGWEHK